MDQVVSPVKRIFDLLRGEKSDISAIYFYAILSSLIQLSLPLGIQAIIGFVIGGTLRASLVVLVAILVAGVLLAGIMQMNQMKIIERIQERIFVKYAFSFADRIPKLNLLSIDSYYLPELTNRFFDIVSLQKTISKLLLDLPVAAIQIIFGLVLLSLYHPVFILFSLLLVFLMWLVLYLTSDKGFETSLAESKSKYELVAWLQEMARLVKSFKFSYQHGLHLKKADERTIRYLTARKMHFKILLTQYKAMVAFKVAVTAALMTVGVLLLLNQQLNIGQFVAAEIIIITVLNSVEKIIVSLESVYDALTSVEKIAKLTDKPVEESGSYKKIALSAPAIEVRNLSFGYYPGRTVINSVSFSVTPGQKVCVTGKNGAGKSSLLKLFTGTYHNFQGSILVDNIPIGNYDLQSLRDQTGIVFPNEDIFHGTLLENLTMGRPFVDINFIKKLCEATGLQSFVSSLPEGFDTELDPTGKRLARNVVQKILLIRALAHQPKLLLLEEPWVNLEEVNKKKIQQIILELRDTTVIVTTDDEAFASKCDQCILLKKLI
jgi:ABC-type bacteriocin/lantibiotic exporter with double-glycine peptidase domain